MNARLFLASTRIGVLLFAIMAWSPMARGADGAMPPAAASATANARRAAHPVDRFIVRFRDGAPERGSALARATVLADAGRDAGVSFRELRRLAVGADVVLASARLDAAAAERIVQRLRRHPRVAYAEVDRMVYAAAAPNDINYARQWSHRALGGGINVPAAWDLSTGAGTVVAVLDTGITTHPDLTANLVAGFDFISDPVLAADGNGRDANTDDPGDWVAAGYCYEGSPAADSSWHGTLVAGVIGAVANNAVGIAGIAHGAKVQPLRVLGKCGGGYLSDLADAMAWASGASIAGVPDNPTPAEVLNLSLSGVGACPATVQAALDLVRTRGSVAVTAMGNDAVDGANAYPANCNHVIAVGATNRDGGRSGYSNFGANMDVYAPGGDPPFYIETTDNNGTQAPSSAIYNGASGTSLATPHVAAVAALMQAYSPNTPDMVEAVIKATARPLPGPCFPGCTASLLDAPRALQGAASAFLFVHDVDILEGDSGTKTVNVTVALSRPLAHAVTFDVGTNGLTATAGSDYVPYFATARSIAAGATSRTFTLTINGDPLDEADETLILYVYNVAGVAVPSNVGTVTISADDLRQLRNNVKATGLSARRGRTLSFYIDTANVRGLLYVMRNGPAALGNNSVVLYTRYGSPPTSINYDCKQVYLYGSCDEPQRKGGRYYIMLEAVEDFADVELHALYAPGLAMDSAGSVVEGQSGTVSLPFTARLLEAQYYDVCFYLAPVDSDATLADNDYVGGVQMGTIPAGQLTGTVNFQVKGDTTWEPNERLNASVYTNQACPGQLGVHQALTTYATGTIINDDGHYAFIRDAGRYENEGTVNFTVTLSEPLGFSWNSYITTSDGSATVADGDYVARNNLNVFTIPAGQTQVVVPVTINPDATIEADETFTATLYGAPGPTLYDGVAEGRILDDDAPLLQISSPSAYEGNAGTRALVFTVTLDKPATTNVTFKAYSWDSGATAGSDYVALPLTQYSIPAGQTQANIAVQVIGDKVLEPDETMVVELTEANGARLRYIYGQGTIENDDGAALTIADVSILEGASGTRVATFTVKLAQATTVDVTYSIATLQVGIATPPSDYVSRTLHGQAILAGQTSRTFEVTINGDTMVEYNETFDVEVYNVTGADEVLDHVAVGTIRNDDGPTLSIGAASVAEGNGSTRQLLFPVTLSQPAGVTVVADVATNAVISTATAPADYQTKQASVTIPAGQTSATFGVVIPGDTVVEANELVYADLLSSSHFSILVPRGTGTILNDDGPTLSIGDVTVIEGHTGTKVATFTATLSQAAAGTVGFSLATANGTAGAGDFVPRAVAGQTIAAGMLARTYAVTVNGDTTIEPNETFLVNLAGATGATIYDGQATGTIRNDDGPTLSIGAASITEGNSGTKLLTFPITLSMPASGPVTFTAATNPAIGNAVAGTDYVAVTTTGVTIPAGQTGTTFSVSIKGDTVVEGNEILYVDLTNAVGASIYTLRGTGTITNDD